MPRRHRSEVLGAALFVLACFAAGAMPAQATPVTDNLSLWLDATDSVIRISHTFLAVGWMDKSGNANHATTVGSPMWDPTGMNGHPAVAVGYRPSMPSTDYFTIPDPGENSTLDMTSQVHMFMVARLLPNDVYYDQQGLLCKGGGGGGDNYIWEVGYVGDDDGLPPYNMNAFDAGGWRTSQDDVVPVNVPVVLEINYDASRAFDDLWRYYVNGTSIGQSEGSSILIANNVDLSIGSQAGLNPSPENTLISEVLMYKSTLTQTQRDAVNAYLIAKYDIPEPATLTLLALGLLCLRSRRTAA